MFPGTGCFRSSLRGILFLSVGLNLAACKEKPAEEKGKPLARVGNSFLYEEDLQGTLVINGDSIQSVKNYIQNWIRETLLLQKAEQNLQGSMEKFDKLAQDYRKSLVTYEYESELIRQKLDTVVSDEEIGKYYEENKENFELKDNIIKVVYVKVRKNAPKVERVKTWYRSEAVNDKDELSTYCLQYADNFYLDDNTWLLFDDILKEIPIKLYDKEAFLQNNRHIETQDSTFYYFVNIRGFMMRKSISPLSFERENVRNILLNKRKVELIRQMREDIYKEGMNNRSFEVY